MNILVIGLGSMGKRRIRLLRQIEPLAEIIGVDAREDRRCEAEAAYGIRTYTQLEEALRADCSAAFICTAPRAHAALTTQCLERGLHVFTEINLVADRYQENMCLAEARGLVLFLSSTFLYRDEVRYIRQAVGESESVLTYSYHIGQYLPDWHPWETYADYFIGDRRTGGCREIMAIEFPWLSKAFGKITDISVKKGKKTSLNIDYDDSYLVLLEHENGAQGALLVDVVSRKAVRNLEIFGEDLYISWDGSPTGLKRYDISQKKETAVDLYANVEHEDGYAAFVVENAYENEIREFFDAIECGKKAEYGFEDDLEILALIDRIERDAK